MSKLESEMRYEIGELVYIASSSHFSGVRPKRFVITGRVIDKCPGGIQRYYRLDGYDGLVPEIVLCRTEPEFQKRSEAESKEADGLNERT